MHTEPERQLSRCRAAKWRESTASAANAQNARYTTAFHRIRPPKKLMQSHQGAAASEFRHGRILLPSSSRPQGLLWLEAHTLCPLRETAHSPEAASQSRTCTRSRHPGSLLGGSRPTGGSCAGFWGAIGGLLQGYLAWDAVGNAQHVGHSLPSEARTQERTERRKYYARSSAGCSEGSQALSILQRREGRTKEGGTGANRPRPHRAIRVPRGQQLAGGAGR